MGLVSLKNPDLHISISSVLEIVLVTSRALCAPAHGRVTRITFNPRVSVLRGRSCLAPVIPRFMIRNMDLVFLSWRRAPKTWNFLLENSSQSISVIQNKPLSVTPELC